MCGRFFKLKSYSSSYHKLVILRNFCQQVTASRRTKVMPSISQAGHSMWVGIFCNHPIFFNSMGFIIEPEPDPVPFSSYIAIISKSLFSFFSLAVLMNLSDLLSRCVDFKKSTKILACWIYIPPEKKKLYGRAEWVCIITCFFNYWSKGCAREFNCSWSFCLRKWKRTSCNIS